MTNQHWQQPPGPGWQPPQAPPPRHTPDKIALIVGAIIIAVALIAAGIFLLTRSPNTDPTPPPGNSTPAHTPHTPQTSTPPATTAEEFTFDDAFPVGGWYPQPVLEGMTHIYYVNDQVQSDSTLGAEIFVGNSTLDFELATSSLDITATSSDGRVVCGIDTDFDDPICYAQTGRFGVLEFGIFNKDLIPISDMASIADALVARYP